MEPKDKENNTETENNGGYEDAQTTAARIAEEVLGNVEKEEEGGNFDLSEEGGEDEKDITDQLLGIEEDEPAVPQKQKVEKDDDTAPTEPPHELSAEEKEIYSKIRSKKLRNGIDKIVSNHRAAFTQTQQRLRAAENAAVQREQQAKHILETVRPYYTQHPELANAQITEAGLVSKLIASHQELTHDNPAIRQSKWLKIGQSIGLVDQNGNITINKSESSSPQNIDIENHPKFRALQDQLNHVKSFTDGFQSQMQNDRSTAIATEIQSVIDEKSATGQYLWPEMHDANYREQAKPLVLALKGASPNLTWGNAYKQAILSMRNLNGNSPQVNHTGLPKINNSHTAAPAAITVRGNGNSTPRSGDFEFPAEALTADPKGTADWIRKNLI